MNKNKRGLCVLGAVLLAVLLAVIGFTALRAGISRQVSEATAAAYAQGYQQGSEDTSGAAYEEGYDDGKQGNLSPADKRTVYVTPSGRKYHRKSCSSIKGHDTEKLEAWEAKERGYTACSKCNP